MEPSFITQGQQTSPTSTKILQIKKGNLPFYHFGGEGLPPFIDPRGVILVGTMLQEVPQFFKGRSSSLRLSSLGHSCGDYVF